MNKTLITLLITFCSITTINAQSKDEVIDKIAQQTCKCIEDKGIDMSKENKSKLEMEFGLCLIESYNKNKKAADKYFEVSLLDEASIESVAELVGIQMVSYCSDVFTIFIEEELENDELDYTEEFIGEFVSISKGDFNVIIIKDLETNRDHKLVWLTYFEGSELFDNPRKLKGKELKIEFEEFEFYDPKIKEYRNFKVINSIKTM